jgi:hypothetical protein
MDNDEILLCKIATECEEIHELYDEYKETLIEYKLNGIYDSKTQRNITLVRSEILRLVDVVNKYQFDLIRKKIRLNSSLLEEKIENKLKKEFEELLENFNAFNYDEDYVAMRYKNSDELYRERERIVSIKKDQNTLLASCGKEFEYGLEKYNLYYLEIAEIINAVYQDVYKHIKEDTKKM